MLLHPAVPLFTTALVIPLLRGKIRTVAVVLGVCLSLIATAALKPGMSWSVNVASMHLTPLKVDELSWLFGIIFALVALLGTIYSMHAHSATEHAAAVTYAGSALGLTFAGDWITASGLVPSAMVKSETDWSLAVFFPRSLISIRILPWLVIISGSGVHR